MAMKATRKNFRREMRQTLRNGPSTSTFRSVWKAALSAIVTSDAGHTQ